MNQTADYKSCGCQADDMVSSRFDKLPERVIKYPEKVDIACSVHSILSCISKEFRFGTE